jgi:hypothetical protein
MSLPNKFRRDEMCPSGVTMTHVVVINGCNTVLLEIVFHSRVMVIIEKFYVNTGDITHVKPLSKIYFTIKYSSYLLWVVWNTAIG